MFRIVRDNPADPIASILSSLLLGACILEAPERLGLTASELGMMIGLVGTIAASVRTLINGKGIK